MGHLANPITTRLNISRIWNSNWSFFSKKTYYYLLNNNLELNNLLDFLIYNKLYKYFTNKGIIVFKYTLYRLYNKTIVYIYIYDSFIYDSIIFIKKKLRFIDSKFKKLKKKMYNSKNNVCINTDKNNFFKKLKLFLRLIILESFYRFNKKQKPRKLKLIQYKNIVFNKYNLDLKLNKSLAGKHYFLLNNIVLKKKYFYLKKYFNFLKLTS